MAELSPAAQVMIAVTHIYQEHGGEPPVRAVAAALRAAAEWVIPDNSGGNNCCIDTCEAIRAEMLAIVAELENNG